MHKKILFFDIDGTLMMPVNFIPESAKQALYEAKANGHKLVICTGRSRAGVPGLIEKLPFAGIGVAMGNADNDLKKKADRITTAINEDGIYCSMKELNLI